MKVFIKMKNGTIDATGDFDPKTRRLVVKKGSCISHDVSHGNKFRGSKAVDRLREEFTKDYVVIADVECKSPSTAANFVTGKSTNGLVTWKNHEGKTIKEILQEQ